MFEFWFSILNKITFCTHILVVFSLKCDVKLLESNELIISQHQDAKLIERESDNLEQLSQTQFNLTRFEFSIQHQENVVILSTAVFEYYLDDSIQQRWFCKLIKYQQYNILCNLYPEINPQNDQNNILMNVNLDIETNLKCEKIFQFQTYFLIFCSDQDNITIYSVDKFNNTVLLENKMINTYQFDSCKRDYVKQSENVFFVYFYDCFYWTILKFSGSTLDLLLDQNIIANKNNQTIPFVENIQTCKYFNNNQSIVFYLINNDGYYQYKIIYNNNILQFELFERSQNVKWLLFTTQCIVQYVVIKQGSITSIMIKLLNQSLVNFESSIIQIYESSKHIFILNQEGLDIILNQQIRQHIQIQTNYLCFLDKDNYFYQIDEINSQISFYSYNNLNTYLIPKKPYVFEFSIKDHFQIILLNCFKIEIQEKDEKLTVFNDFQIENSCQEQFIITFDKQSIALPQIFDFQVSVDSNEQIVDITEFVDLQEFCSIKQIPKDSVLLYCDKNYALLHHNNYITIKESIKDFNQKVPHQFYNVLLYQLSFILIKERDKYIKVIYTQIIFEKPLIYQISLKNEIEYFVQYQNYVLIITQKAQNLFIIQIDTLQQQVLPNFLSVQLTQIYNKKRFENDTVFFYNRIHNICYIQFFGIFIIYDLQIDQIKKSLTTNLIQIISLRKLIQNAVQILAVHQIENVIIQYFFTDYQHLIVQKNYTLTNVQFVRPLKYQVERYKDQTYLIILVQKEDFSYLYIFCLSLTKPLKLIRIIQTSKQNFFVANKILYYYDENLIFKAIDIFQIHIKIKNLESFQRTAFTSINSTFKIVPNNKAENVINCIIRLNFYNFCHKLFNILNQSQIIMNSQLKYKIPINDYFIGPIQQLKINNNSNVKLNGFYHQQETVVFCKQHNDYNCIFTIHIIKTVNGLKKEFIVNILKQQQKNTLLSLIDVFTKKKLILNPFIEMFLIDNWQLFIIQEQQDNIIIIIYKMDCNTYKIEKEQEFKLQNNLHISEYRYHQTGDLIQIKSTKEEILFFTQTLQIHQQFITNFKEGILFVKDSNQLYLELQLKEQNLLINIMQYNEQKFQSTNILILHSKDLIQKLNIHFNEYFYEIQKLSSNHLLEALQEGNQIKFKILQIYQNYGLFLNASIDLTHLTIQFQIKYVLRIFNSCNQPIQVIYQNNILMLILDQNKKYLYDLNQDKIFHDYQYLENSTSTLITSINSTHFIFLNDNDNYQIGQLYYEIELSEGDLNQETCFLVAENLVSIAEIKLIIKTNIPNDNQFKTVLIFIIILTLLIFIAKYLRKVINLKKRAYQTQIELQTSNIQNFEQ